jgi:hypothetical protein
VSRLDDAVGRHLAQLTPLFFCVKRHRDYEDIPDSRSPST